VMASDDGRVVTRRNINTTPLTRGVRGESNPLPRRSRRRMPSRYTTDTINGRMKEEG